MKYLFPCKPNRIAPDSDYFSRLDNDPKWICEIKKNGIRCLAIKDKNLSLMTRHNTFVQEPLFELRQALLAMMPNDTMIDGELINNRRQKQMAGGIYYVFDLLTLGGESILSLPLSQRREMLDSIIDPVENCIEIAEQFNLGKKKVYELAIAEGEINEGIVIKKLDSKYLASPTRCLQHPYWLKVKRPEKHLYQGGRA